MSSPLTPCFTNSVNRYPKSKTHYLSSTLEFVRPSLRRFGLSPFFLLFRLCDPCLLWKEVFLSSFYPLRGPSFLTVDDTSVLILKPWITGDPSSAGYSPLWSFTVGPQPQICRTDPVPPLLPSRTLPTSPTTEPFG